jgi:peptidoglycan hydrolase-like protein with peptidoglycan-binding domain
MLITAARLIRGSCGLTIAGLLLASLTWASGSAPSKGASGKPPNPKKATVGSAAKTAAKKTPTRKRRYRREPFRYRLARLKLQPERIQEIQQALITQSYLHQDPTGKWDDATRDAMRRFQADHGFPTTGMPEAKSLMKLGLGPHPLPDELGPSAQARAGTAPLTQPDSSTPGATPIAQE